MTLAAAHDIAGPVYLRLGRYPVPDVVGADYRFELGKAGVLREGTEITLFACGHMVWVALQAAELLAQRQVSVRVLNMSTIKPLDVEAVRYAQRTTPLVATIEEHSIIGGLGSAVAEVMAEDGCGARLVRLGTHDCFGESGVADELLARHNLTPQAVADRLGREFGR